MIPKKAARKQNGGWRFLEKTRRNYNLSICAAEVSVRRKYKGDYSLTEYRLSLATGIKMSSLFLDTKSCFRAKWFAEPSCNLQRVLSNPKK